MGCNQSSAAHAAIVANLSRSDCGANNSSNRDSHRFTGTGVRGLNQTPQAKLTSATLSSSSKKSNPAETDHELKCIARGIKARVVLSSSKPKAPAGIDHEDEAKISLDLMKIIEVAKRATTVEVSTLNELIMALNLLRKHDPCAYERLAKVSALAKKTVEGKLISTSDRPLPDGTTLVRQTSPYINNSMNGKTGTGSPELAVFEPIVSRVSSADSDHAGLEDISQHSDFGFFDISDDKNECAQSSAVVCHVVSSPHAHTRPQSLSLQLPQGVYVDHPSYTKNSPHSIPVAVPIPRTPLTARSEDESTPGSMKARSPNGVMLHHVHEQQHFETQEQLTPRRTIYQASELAVYQ
jgi:hypothetical protein